MLGLDVLVSGRGLRDFNYGGMDTKMKKRMERAGKWIGISGFLLLFVLLFVKQVRAEKTYVPFRYQSEAGECGYMETGLTNRIQTLYDGKMGLTTNEANAVLQTREGYLWIGSYGGLIRYDGASFRNYSMEENGIESFSIRALFEDRLGRLWIGTNDKGVYRYENGAFIHCRTENQELYQSVRCFAQDKDGTVYAGTSSGLLAAREFGELEVQGAEKLKNQTVYSLSFDENGALWGTAGEGNAFCLKQGEMVYWFSKGTLSGLENYTILASGQYIYIGTAENILIRLTMKDWDYTEDSYWIESFGTANIQTINTLFVSSAGEVWVGADTGYAWFDREMKLHTIYASQHAAFISSISEDYEGNIWMASTQGGVYRIAEGKFLNGNVKAGLEGHPINAVEHAGEIFYFASDDGLFLADCNWGSIKNSLTDLLAGVRIRHLFKDSEENLWISTYGAYGLLRYTPSTGGVVSITEEQGLLSNKVRKVIELKNGDFAVATTGGINILHGLKVVKSYGQKQGLLNPVILCLLELSDGTLLAGSDGQGIYAISQDKVTNIHKSRGLEFGAVLRMREDKESNGIWISAGNSLFFMDMDWQVQKIDFPRGIGSVLDILVSGDNIWLMKGSGLFSVKKEYLLGQQQKEMAIAEYGADSGLTAALSANSWNLYENGILYLCTSSGVCMLDTNSSPALSAAPKTAVNEIRIYLEDTEEEIIRDGGEPIVLPSNTKRVTIQFACLSFGLAPCMVEYYLEGFDQSPVRFLETEGNSVSYTNLPGGSYVFRLKAENPDGVKSDYETAVFIRKEKRSFEYPGFWISIGVLALLFLLGGHQLVLHFRTKRIRRRQQEYKAITDQALKTIANTIDAKDSYTKGHSVRVAGYSREIARRLSMTEEEQEQVYYIALLHDIGKIGIPDAILNKPEELEESEYLVMRRHTSIGGEILKDFTALPDIGQGAVSHHERYDGKGYPAGLKGEEIPLVARIICTADTYDAMSTKRAYRSPRSREYILSEFQKYSGAQFDPRITEIMIAMIEEEFNPQSLDNISGGLE